MKTFINISGVVILLLISRLAMADITLKTTAQVEVTTANRQGVKIVERKPVREVIPGTIVIYMITAKNTGHQSADKVVVTNPVPKHTVYIAGSAFGVGTDISFSIDGGKHYAKADKLMVKDASGKSHHAKPADFTNIRWVFHNKLKAGAQAQVGYRVKVK